MSNVDSSLLSDSSHDDYWRDKERPTAAGNDREEAKKYPMSGNLKGTIYGSPEVSSIIATFEGNLLDLHGKRPYYKETSKAWYKHQDRIRLEAAQAIMDYKAVTKVSDLPTERLSQDEATQMRQEVREQLLTEIMENMPIKMYVAPDDNMVDGKHLPATLPEYYNAALDRVTALLKGYKEGEQ